MEKTFKINGERLLSEAKLLQTELISIRRKLHMHPEVGFDLPYTKMFVKQRLEEFGYVPQEFGKAGILAIAGGKKREKLSCFVQIWMHCPLTKKLM